MPEKRSRILSVGTAVPERVLTNADLEKTLDTSDEWIVTRTGIRQRRVFSSDAPGQAFKLGAEASSQALERAGLKASDIDGIICATFTPDFFFPSTACLIGRELGIEGAAAFDISAACAGFVYGLTVADSMIIAGRCRNVLLVGSEIISKTLDWQDRSTSILFGDGAGAVIVAPADGSGSGILSTYLGSDCNLSDILTLPAFGSERIMKMKGNEVFRNAVRMMGDATLRAIERAGFKPDDIDLLIPHQANIRIIKSLAKHLGFPMEKVVTNLEKFGNTSSASIPLALDDAWSGGKIGDGTVVAMTSLGGGVTYGSAVIRF